MHFFLISSIRDQPGALEYLLAETVSLSFSIRNPLGFSDLFVSLATKPIDLILTYCFVPGGEYLSPGFWHPVRIFALGTPKVCKTDVAVLSLNVGPVQVSVTFF
jgi:hypothetical protein